jgi:hypothetical protein
MARHLDECREAALGVIRRALPTHVPKLRCDDQTRKISAAWPPFFP